MERIPASRARRRWRAFATHDADTIDGQLRQGEAPRCPDCGEALSARPLSRRKREVPLDALSFDLDCLGCLRYHGVVIHSERSLRLVRMRRLAAAVRAVPPEPLSHAAV